MIREKRKTKNKWHRRKQALHVDDPKKYWRAINDLVNPKPQNPVHKLTDQNSKIPVPNSDTADFINSYFATI